MTISTELGLPGVSVSGLSFSHSQAHTCTRGPAAVSMETPPTSWGYGGDGVVGLPANARLISSFLLLTGWIQAVLLSDKHQSLNFTFKSTFRACAFI